MRLSAPTRLTARAAVAILGVLTLALTACSSSSSPSPKASAKVSASASSGTSGSSSVKGLFPAVSGSYGTKPTLTFPVTAPSSALQVKVLSTGTGRAVAKNDLLIADYLGQIWHGKVFDNSYDRKEPIATPIGNGSVIKGWDDALVGKKVGSRVLLSIPPSLGYGSAGQASAGIKGTDTLVFVIDIVSAYSKSDTGDKTAVVQKVSTAPVTVTGALGAEPKIAVTKGAAIPAAAKTVVLAKGKGAVTKAGFVVLQYQAVYYDGTVADSTFVRGQPQATEVGVSGSTNPFDGVIGVPIGSRVLITTPAETAAGAKAGLAIVADIIAQSGTAAEVG